MTYLFSIARFNPSPSITLDSFTYDALVYTEHLRILIQVRPIALYIIGSQKLNIFVAQLRIIIPASESRQVVRNSMCHVFYLSCPFQVRSLVVNWNTILVIHLRLILWIRNKRLRDQTMDELLIAMYFDSCSKRAFPSAASSTEQRFQNTPMLPVANSPEIRYFIFGIQDWSPSLS